MSAIVLLPELTLGLFKNILFTFIIDCPENRNNFMLDVTYEGICPELRHKPTELDSAMLRFRYYMSLLKEGVYY